jgi:hypothetical protein
VIHIDRAVHDIIVHNVLLITQRMHAERQKSRYLDIEELDLYQKLNEYRLKCIQDQLVDEKTFTIDDVCHFTQLRPTIIELIDIHGMLCYVSTSPYESPQ